MDIFALSDIDITCETHLEMESGIRNQEFSCREIKAKDIKAVAKIP